HGSLSIRRQCALLGIARSGVYRPPPAANDNDLSVMRRIDELFTAWPFLVGAASKTDRAQAVCGLHEYASLLDRSPERLRWCRVDGRAFIDRPVGLPVIRPQRPIAAAHPDAELRGDEVGQHRLDLHAGAFVRRFRIDADDLPGVAEKMGCRR